MEVQENTSFGMPQSRVNIIYYANKYDADIATAFGDGGTVRKASSFANLFETVTKLSVYELDVSILVEVQPNEFNEALGLVERLKKNWLSRNLVVIFLLTEKDPAISAAAFAARVADCYSPEIAFADVKLRLQFLSAYKILNEQLKDLPEAPLKQYKAPFAKRFLDLAISISAFIVLSPLLIIIAILIKLDSKGPIFYTSKRVGTGYKIFDFYKFRSMRVNADKEVENLKATTANQYGDSAFFKMKDDPRVTKLGNFLRNSSIDELPQLFNVIKGDMSIVGNRPLPLYEAEQLTTNEWSMRFLGPAGITGLWQIIKRGKSDMSDRERKKLDNFYNKKFSIWLDLKIILMTVPVLLQKEKV
ncbi:sugar transferase [Pedobacter xixiisoli]|uniref:Sugar transferase involved in LPS biosynthesis (Colanic, teichoic acid) n=1 Tax=Pedobacter xixiisoli TaxID=1476464 RepID=A0A286ACL8_9SPHI|nr:sugar transferase [Pedobacter xixiisoli]SOD19625.1 Sugar transferase involved in LPS biosynthesis (colanic, teichoic acid) [Pedobacter xixiisoli]